MIFTVVKEIAEKDILLIKTRHVYCQKVGYDMKLLLLLIPDEIINGNDTLNN